MSDFLIWSDYAGLSEDELRELFTENELEVIRRQKLIMYIYYKNLVQNGEADFWEAVDSVRNGLIGRYGEEAVLQLEFAAVQMRYDIADINNVMPYASELFSSDVLDREGAAELEEASKALNISKEDVAAIGLAAMADTSVTGDLDRLENETVEHCASRNYDRIADKLIHTDDPIPPDSLRRMRKASMYHVKNALKDMKDGNVETLAKTMRAGIKKGCEKFADAREAKDAAGHAMAIRDMLGMVEERPELMSACGFSAEELQAAYGAVVMGDIILKGMHALELYQEAALSGRELPREKKEEYCSDILQMSMVLNDRERQIEVFRDKPEEKLAPTKMQFFFGQRTSVKNVKQGKMSQNVLENRKCLKMSDVFKNMVKKETFATASVMSKKDECLKIGKQAVFQLVSVKDKIITESAVKDLEQGKNKEVKKEEKKNPKKEKEFPVKKMDVPTMTINPNGGK